MPLDPHTWDGDFVTATLLDNDLYLYGGQIFTPNGIRFHARRALYKSYSLQTGNSTTSGNWCLPYAGSGNTSPESNVIVDTPGLVGAWFDPFTTGNIKLNNLTGAGGFIGVNSAGLGLMIGYALWPAVSGTGNYASGLGLSSSPSSPPTVQGTFQATNSAHQGCSLTIDLVDLALQRWALFGFNGSGSSISPSGVSQTDGSGWASRLHAHWTSVYPSNGFTVVNAPAPLANWTTSTVLTSSLFNFNTGIRNVLRFFNMPPQARADNSGLGSQSLPANTGTTVTLSNTVGTTTYTSFASNTFTAPFNGLYFVHGYVACQNFSGNLRCGVNIGGTTYWGPYTPCPGSGEVGAVKTQIFSLNAGDTIVLKGEPTAAANTSTAHPARLVVVYVGAQGAPASLPTPPDTTFRWTAGSPGPNALLFNQHIANDLQFLNQRPYLLSYQNTPQTGISPSANTTITMDTVQGIVHGDAGDPWSGWTSGASNHYTAPVSGWYLCVEESFLQAPSLTSTPSVVATLALNPGGQDVDRYQQQNMVTGIAGSGATAVSYYYLRAGDTIKPGLETYDSTSGTIATAATNVNSHFELIWLGE